MTRLLLASSGTARAAPSEAALDDVFRLKNLYFIIVPREVSQVSAPTGAKIIEPISLLVARYNRKLLEQTASSHNQIFRTRENHKEPDVAPRARSHFSLDITVTHCLPAHQSTLSILLHFEHDVCSSVNEGPGSHLCRRKTAAAFYVPKACSEASKDLQPTEINGIPPQVHCCSTCR